MKAEIFTFAETTQITVDDELRIGAGNFWEEDLTDTQSESHLTAGVWFFFRTQEDLDQHQRVASGQVLAVGNYEIEVLSIVKPNEDEMGEISLHIRY